MISETFFDYFKDYTDCYVIIGGNAASILLAEEGVSFRSTQDYDMVVLFEKTTDDFSNTFMNFIKEYDYAITDQGTKENKRKNYYRFRRRDGTKTDVPKMVELFSRKPINYELHEVPSEITPLHYDEGPSLSAIILNDDYYETLKLGVRLEGNMPLLATPYLILFKARAHLDILKRVMENKHIGHRADKTKHFKDVCRLTSILTLGDYDAGPIPETVLNDLREFIKITENTEPTRFKIIDSSLNKAEVVASLQELLIE
ncbi:hypothetical protein [Levilactobacillus fujinensis]|uniref:Nucleotidyl transferase AbiEii/AbiGii toxin family protein n=1 Tax=Levilactobacillus fujinensis TaxID=2486024 RepID=A0ABW1TCY2_9LACO